MAKREGPSKLSKVERCCKVERLIESRKYRILRARKLLRGEALW